MGVVVGVLYLLGFLQTWGEKYLGLHYRKD